jgi:hypothetical protein
MKAEARAPRFLDRVERLVPRCLEFRYAFVLDDLHHIAVADTELLQVGEDLPGRIVGAATVSPWLAVALMVASGMVLTVSETTSSVTYMVSGNAGSFVDVEAHSGR